MNDRRCRALALCATLACLTALLCHPAGAAGPVATGTTQLNDILVTARRELDAAADLALTETATATLHADPYFLDTHVYVTVHNGTLTLHGVVFDEWDLRIALRHARKVPGVRRVVNDLEIKLGGE